MGTQCKALHKPPIIFFAKKLFTSLLLTLPTLGLSLNAESDVNESIHIIGSPTIYGIKLIEKLSKTPLSQRTTLPVTYINAADHIHTNDFNTIQDLLSNNTVIILDGTEITPDAVQTLSAKLTGIGLAANILLIRKSADQIPEYKQIMLTENQGLTEPIAVSYQEQNLSIMLHETTKGLASWQSSLYRSSHSKPPIQGWRPEVSIPVELRHIGFSCLVGNQFVTHDYHNSEWTGGQLDPCNRQASFSLFYTVDLIHSTATHATDSSGGKYLRITVNPEFNGGGGWHLVNQPRHKHTWFESWTNRTTWYGPIASSYAVSIQSLDPDIRLYNAIPGNTPRHSKVSTINKIAVGFKGVSHLPETSNDFDDNAESEYDTATENSDLLYNSALDTLDSSDSDSDHSNNTQSAQRRSLNRKHLRFIDTTIPETMPAGIFSYSSTRAVNYQTEEYAVINQSKTSNGDKAAWIWDRQFDQYAKEWRTHSTCPLWCTDWFFDDAAFSPAAYAHFTPGFSATFRAEENQQTPSQFEFIHTITPVALGGRVKYDFFYQRYANWSQNGSTYTFGQRLTIDWRKLNFQAPLPFTVQLAQKDLCLNIQEGTLNSTASVNLYKCNTLQNQQWLFTANQQIKSVLNHNMCLSLEDNLAILLKSCNGTRNQHWAWDRSQLINGNGAAVTTTDNHRLKGHWDHALAAHWHYRNVPKDLKNLLTVEAL
ncbi:cytolysin [Elysia marginata]|uniref:Cytolysin n=1 Tax=Elysia marginata TaxID=1093978 RepID=A0AAV4FVT5_9GAST|nr:cytolysin [Elysia marginata]